MNQNFSNAKSDFSSALTSSAPIRTSHASTPCESTAPAPLMWCFMATAIAVFLMVFTGRLVGDAAGYCLLTVIVVGLMLFRSGKVEDDEA